jgi:hypothetical protein
MAVQSLVDCFIRDFLAFLGNCFLSFPRQKREFTKRHPALQRIGDSLSLRTGNLANT